MTITLFDVLFLLAMVAGAAWGFYRRLLRQAVAILVLYISTVIAAVGHRGLSRMLGGAGAAEDALAFIGLLGILNVLLFLLSNDLINEFAPEREHIWANLTGMVVGFVNIAIWCAVLLMIVRSATKGGPWVGYEGVRLFLRNQTYNSWMAYAFRPFMELLLATIRPWMFGYGLPPLLVDAL